MVPKDNMKTYLWLSIIFGIVFFAALIVSIVVPTNWQYADDCIVKTVTVKSIYNNKSVDIRMETEDYVAVFTIPSNYETTEFMKEIQAVINDPVWQEVKLRIAINKDDEALLDKRPRRAIAIRQIEAVSDDKVILSYDNTNEADRQKLMGNKILMVSFSGCALVVCVYHIIRTRPKMNHPVAEKISDEH